MNTMNPSQSPITIEQGATTRVAPTNPLISQSRNLEISQSSISLPVVKLNVVTRTKLADTITPVGLYLKARDRFHGTVLLESTDFRSLENCFSFIGIDPIASFKVTDSQVEIRLPGHPKISEHAAKPAQVLDLFGAFTQTFERTGDTQPAFNGFFGHSSFDAVQYFDTIRLDPAKRTTDIPDMHYCLYRFVIAFNHFKDELVLLENIPEGESSRIDQIEALVRLQSYGEYRFERVGEEKSNLSDEDYRQLVRLGKRHCQLGDVFQIVLSRQFSQPFRGDEFNVYRILRSINPSPYLFYFDYGSYKIFGSSPEAQLIVKNGIAQVNPIAGTYRRTGNDDEDRIKAQELAHDPKENAEHIMLVDLARNDLSKHAVGVKVSQLKEIQFYSHVIHLVSRVEGRLRQPGASLRVFADTFPAGTLSGAPKYKALQLIDQYENQRRHFYGGAIGCIGFDGSINQAIVIRSFLSKDNVLYFQAGAGIVAASNEESELQEVNNKLGALKRALLLAENTIGNS